MVIAPTRKAIPIPIELAEWAKPLFEPFRYKVLYGGRSSGKTQQAGGALIVQSFMAPHVIYCCREHLKSLDDSAKRVLVGWIRRLDLAKYFSITQNQITNLVTGAYFRFHGLSVVSEEDIKGWEGVTRCWVEEAHTMSIRSRELLYPTIMRQPDSELWVTFNPKNRYDPVYKDFVSGDWGEANRYVKKVNFNDNPWFPEGEEELRREFEKSDPLRYAHIWLGEPDDESAERKVLPYALLMKCVEAWDKRPVRGVYRVGGLDIADTGAAWNTLVLRSGPELFAMHRWKGTAEIAVSDSVVKATKICLENGVNRLDYDAGGPGAGARGPIRDYLRKTRESLMVNGVSFGGKVQGPKVIYLRSRPRGITNEMYFANWHSQAAMVLRQRADMTSRLMGGQDIDPHGCLFINPEIPDLEELLRECAQPEWSDDTGKYRVEKQPHPAWSVQATKPGLL